MVKKLLLPVLASALLSTVYSEAGSVPSGSESGLTGQTTEKPAQQDKAVSDEIEQAQEALKYGIVSEVLEVTDKIQKQNFEMLEKEFAQAFADSTDPAIKEGIIGVYRRYEHSGLQEPALVLLETYTDQRRTLVKAVLSYLNAVPPAQHTNLRSILHTMLKEETAEYGVESVDILGALGSAEDAVFLMDFFETYTGESEKQELIIKQHIAVALEKIHSENCWDFFLERASDEDENAYIRASAASGLAQIGKPEAFTVLAEFFTDSDPILRTAAIKGIAAFETPESEKILLQGMRDNHHQVRLESLETVTKTKNEAAAPYVLYRAKHDPTEKIRFRAIETLAQLNTTEGNQWLSETFSDSKKGEVLRVKILSALLKHNFAVISADIEKIILPAVTDDKQKKFRYAAGKAIAESAQTDLAAVCTAFLKSSDTLTKSIGLDMFHTGRYAESRSEVENIAQDEKNGILQRRAQRLLEIKTE